jgi:hypothetical protein
MVRRLEGNMVAAGQLAGRRLAVDARDEEFVDPEVVVGDAADRNFQGVEHRLVEPATCPHAAHDELDMIDEATAMEFLRFHA